MNAWIDPKDDLVKRVLWQAHYERLLQDHTEAAEKAAADAQALIDALSQD